MFRTKRAFSLIELMIVVAILGILVAVALPQFTSMTNDAKVAKAKESAATLIKALMLYNNTKPKPAENIDELVPSQMAKIPDDPWGNKFKLDAELGMIYSVGPDGKDGTIDDISVSYLPPLMPLAAQFVDAGPENPGFVGLSDEIVITFTRPLNDNPAPTWASADWTFYDNNGKAAPEYIIDYYDGTKSDTVGDGTGAAVAARFDDGTTASFYRLDDVDLRKLIIVLGSKPILVPGATYLNLTTNDTGNIRDMSKDAANANGKSSQQSGSHLLLSK